MDGVNAGRDHHAGGLGDSTGIKRDVAEAEVDGDGAQWSAPGAVHEHR